MVGREWSDVKVEQTEAELVNGKCFLMASRQAGTSKGGSDYIVRSQDR